MGKPSKNSGGDERMYDRRYKPSSNPSKASSSEKQGEAESSNRSKPSGVAIKQNLGVTKNKSKLRSPVKTGLGNPTNRLNRPNIVSEDKGIKKSGAVVKDKSQISKMKQTENLDKKEKKIESTEPTEQIIETIKQGNEASDNLFNQQENGLNVQETSNSNGNGAEILDINEKEEEFNLQFERDDNGIKHEENGFKNSSEVIEKENSEKIEDTVHEDKSIEENSQSDKNSCSVDVVESTTSEISEATESTAPSETKDKDVECQETNEDENSDSTKVLKDVKIKLHDCLKDQKNEEENSADQSVPEYRHKEDTFGKTLRTLSGRKSIGRHITLRERQPSPNSSLFVNTSSISTAEDGSSEYKTLRPRTALSELSSSNNGTSVERKRRLIQETSASPKKQKTEEGSLLNASFEFLKYPFNLRRPVQVSTPYKFGEVEKPNVSSSEEVKVNEEVGAGRKWCVVM